MNWLDFVLGAVLIASIVEGWMKGMLRIGIGFAATVAAFIVASWTYGTAGLYLRGIIHSHAVANFLGFFIVFGAIMALGGIVSIIAARIFKAVGLGWADRTMGAAFGTLRGILVTVVIVMVMTAFAPPSARSAVADSRLAPHILTASHVLSDITPHEIKDGFRDGYQDIKQMWAETFKDKRHPKVGDTAAKSE